MTTVQTPMDEWKKLPWKRIEREVFKLQKRIYRASTQNDRKQIHRLQRLLMKSRSARLLAVRRVTQDNLGKKTAGIDGVKSLTPKQRVLLSNSLSIKGNASPVRRVQIPKPGTTEKRGLGIPVMADRAAQALVKTALEPEWEARFEANSYGFRPGRSCHDAIEAIFASICQHPKWVLDADIAKCFDRIAHEPLLEKVQTSPTLRRQLRAWLRAGVMEHGELFPTEAGTPQGGCISPLLANIALHGLDDALVQAKHLRPNGSAPVRVVRYADDFVVLHKDREVIHKCQQFTQDWLKQMGLELKQEKTRVVHTLAVGEHDTGFQFLGFNIRQFPVGKNRSGTDSRGNIQGFKTRITPSKQSVQRHVKKLRETLRRHRSVDQENLIKILHPQIVGWCAYFATASSHKVFGKIQTDFFAMLLSWAARRHPNHGTKWVADKYWRFNDGHGWIFQPRGSCLRMPRHTATRKNFYVKVAGRRTPYDGDWIYWSTRMGREPTTPNHVAWLLKKQGGQCRGCGLYFRSDDVMEVDHVLPKSQGGTWARWNLQLLHRHCHHCKTASD